MNEFIMHKMSKRVVFIALFVLIIPVLLFYNLEMSPRPWHDDGNAMLVARAVAEDGVYAVKSSEGYQTFGAVQSVGPTVILPVALSFKLFGVGILQGRVIAAIYSFITLLVIYTLIKTIFNEPSALLGVLFLLGSASSLFLFFGRQVLGEVPALGFFLAGWYLWYLGWKSKKWICYVFAGILIGAAMVTKNTYAVLGGAVFVAVAFLDLIYYRQKQLLPLMGMAGASFVIFFLWVIFQRQYFGSETFMKNLALLNQLGKATTGFSVGGVVERAKFLLDANNDYFYFLWGFPAIVYAVILCLQKNEKGFIASVLTTFALLWLAYYFYSVPWPAYLFAPMAIIALFMGMLLYDLIVKVRLSWETIAFEVRTGNPSASTLFIALSVGLLIFVLYPLQNAVQFSVLVKDDSPERTANFLNSEAGSDVVIETWERELGILTNHHYHYPDQSYLIEVHAATYRGASQDYLLGYDYFKSVSPKFVIVGWFARKFQIYDQSFLNANSEMVAQFGEGFTSYEIYKIKYPLVAPK